MTETAEHERPEPPPRQRRWKRWIEESDNGAVAMGVASFLESTVVPIPLEAILVPYLLARSDRIWRTCAAVLLGSVAGALVGYGIGLVFMETVGVWIVDAMGWSDWMEEFEATLDANGFWAILAIGVSPVPFQAAMLGAGIAAYPLSLFLLATLIARGIRYFGLGLLVRALGSRAEVIWEKHARTIAIVTGALLAGFLAWAIWTQ